MDIFLTVLAISGFILTLLGIIIAIYGPENTLELIKRILSIHSKPPNVPSYEDIAKQWREEYISRVNNYITKNLNDSKILGLRKSDDFLSPSSESGKPLIDCICSVLVHNGRVFLIFLSPSNQSYVGGIGRTALIVRLLNLKLPYTKLIGLELTNINKLDITFPQAGEWKLLSSDMAYLWVSNGRLSVAASKGEKINFLWDLTRHIFRSTDLSYTTGAHITNFRKRELLEALFFKIPCKGLNNLYVDITRPFSVDEILFVKWQESSDMSIASRILSRDELLNTLENSILISTNKHNSNFWKRSPEQLKPAIHYLLGQMSQLLPTRELVLNSPDSNVPSFLYDEIVQALNTGNFKMTEKDNTEHVFWGINEYNNKLFNAISSSSLVKMLVTSGEKVFNDGAFWRHLSKSSERFEFEILMLDPTSTLVEELEKIDYKDKPKGFLKEEIELNIEAIQRANNYISNYNPHNISIRCWLYKNRPDLRITLIGDERAIIAHYFPGYRTGNNTLFLDIHGSRSKEFVEAVKMLIEDVKNSSKEVILK